MAVRIDQLCQGLGANALRRRNQRERERRMAGETRIDQDMAVAALEQDVVRRQPVADEDVELRRQEGFCIRRHRSFSRNSPTIATRSASSGAARSMRTRSCPAK